MKVVMSKHYVVYLCIYFLLTYFWDLYHIVCFIIEVFAPTRLSQTLTDFLTWMDTSEAE